MAAIRDNNQIHLTGNVRIGDYNYLTPANTTVKNISDFGDIPLIKNGIQTVFIKDVASVEDAAGYYYRIGFGQRQTLGLPADH